MGVHGLWDILTTTATKVSIQQLSGKILAIDASIWLVKADSIFHEDSQKLKCILDKIIYLRKHNVLPVFVFDGMSPAIKRRTLHLRRQKIKQGSEVDVKKRTQIEVMHLLEEANGNKNAQRAENQSSKERRLREVDYSMGEINKLLDNLTQIQQKQVSETDVERFEKIRLQSQVLTYKYQLLLEDSRSDRVKQKIPLEEFEPLDIESKNEEIEFLKAQMYKHDTYKRRKQQIQEKSKLTPEEQVLQDLQEIKKTTKLRELQDQLYRKTLNKNTKIENGYEIVEQIRNGKKRTMKRKINQKSEAGSQNFGRGSKKEKNNFKEILNYQKVEGQEVGLFEDDQDQYGNCPDPFLLDLMGKDLSKSKNLELVEEKRENSTTFLPKTKSSLTNPSKKQPNNNSNKNQNSGFPAPQKKENPILVTRYIPSEEFEESPSQFEFKQLQTEHIAHSGQNQVSQSSTADQEAGNIDRLPAFSNYRNLTADSLESDSHRNIEFQKLLQMLGVPYLMSPSEAQAQCAQLQTQGLVDGVVTEDSDVFLFGAKHVFRGVFNDNIKYFSSLDISEKLALSREKMIIFALFLGSDYTDGIKGIGIVNAMQILKIFGTFEKLQQFKKWAMFADILHAEENNKTENVLKGLSDQEEKGFYQFHRKFKNYWYIDESFPKSSVIDAYLKPEVVDEQRMSQLKNNKYFQLKQFNEDAVRTFMRERLFFTHSETEAGLNTLKKPFRRQEQRKMTDFFGSEHQFAIIKSKRLQKAIVKDQKQ